VILLGSYTLPIQNDGRLIFPALLRPAFAERAYVTQGLDRNIWILTPSAFSILYENLSRLSMTDPLARMLLRIVLGMACDQPFDAEGGLAVPASLRTFAGLDHCGRRKAGSDSCRACRMRMPTRSVSPR
jgi:MraZ protein